MTTEIREASERDLPGLAELLGAREGLSSPYLGTRRALLDLDPARGRVWVGIAAERVVALSCVELRRLQVGATTCNAGYWTALYVHPDHPDPQLDVRLGQAMLGGLEQLGITRVYLSVRGATPRAASLLETHARIGSRELARYVVRMKPLRPLSLVSKQLRLPELAQRVAAPLDRVAGLPLRLPGWRPDPPPGSSVVTLSLVEDGEAVAQLLMRARAGKVTRAWDLESLCARYHSAKADARYTLLGLCQAGVIIGVAVFRVRTRTSGVRVGVVLELAARDDDSATLALLLRSIERRARARSADAVLLLDSLGDQTSKLARAAGYLDIGERVTVLTATGAEIANSDLIHQAQAWRFPLGDHDSF
ncbi:hypothetical protein DB30_06281 [Enhygromyxa salina]|uniref:N-acetyltransferase domain-containing protein n=1 Tax=Enhygromyxa salina TaxID=215803 RepID=A0A0C1ZUU3_9BACT|nr:hypothetical protein [Enhygromyxa salina]KIG14828.1 hypothetical protein DB30_06281 [Enhygromyxa salina]